jgi:hypothetical protein
MFTIDLQVQGLFIKIDKVEFCSHWVLSPQFGTHSWRKR